MRAAGPDYYALLGVARDATPDEIKKAYRKLARELHPDVNPDLQSQERFKIITAAYEVLSDPEKRQMFDLGGDPLSSSGGGNPKGFDFGDIMDAFFGGGGGQRGPRTRARRGQDAMIRIQITLSAAVFGETREITVDTAAGCATCGGRGTASDSEAVNCVMCKGRGEVQQVQRSFLGQVMTSRPCPTCQGFGSTIPHPCHECAGDGRVRTRRTITIKVPPGVDTGTRIQLTGEGEVGPNGGPAGDLYIEVMVQPHSVFERQGDELHCVLTLPMTSAALGTTVKFDTLDGEQEIDVRPGIQPGAILTLRGLGAARLRGGGRGDLYVHIDVAIPTKLDDAQATLLKQLADLRSEDVVRVGDGGDDAGGGLFTRLKDAFSPR